MFSKCNSIVQNNQIFLAAKIRRAGEQILLTKLSVSAVLTKSPINMANVQL
jgi:hypothetical protein